MAYVQYFLIRHMGALTVMWLWSCCAGRAVSSSVADHASIAKSANWPRAHLGCHKTFCEERAWWLMHHASAGWVGPWSRGQHWGIISWYCMDHEFGFMWRNSMEEFGRIVFEMPNATITWTATKKHSPAIPSHCICHHTPEQHYQEISRASPSASVPVSWSTPDGSQRTWWNWRFEGALLARSFMSNHATPKKN